MSEPGGRSQHCMLPSLRNENFTGRSVILGDLQQKLFVRRECRKLAIVGLGGVGKTQVALQFAYWVKENQPEYNIFWVPVSSIASFTQAYLEIGKISGVDMNPDKEDPRKSVQRHLSSQDAGRWLLIVDNADDKDVLFGSSEEVAGIHEYLPESDAGMTLFTTRSREMAIAVAASNILELHEMVAVEAENFLRKSLIKKQLLQDKVMTSTLLRELTYLPLAIMQAVAYINRNEMPLKTYLELLHGTEQDLVSLMSSEFQDITRYRGSRNAVATTWLVSFHQIQESNPVAADLLSFISCIEPKAIPRSILLHTRLQAEIESAIGTLSAYAFLVRREDDKVYDMHRLVQLATRIWIRTEKRTEETIARAIQHVGENFPSFKDRADRQVWQAYFPHAFRLLDISNLCPSEERFRLAYQVGCCLYKDRRFTEAIRYLEQNRDWGMKHLARTDANLLESERALASAYLDDRRSKDAIQILEDISSVDNRDEEDEKRLDSEHELARAYLRVNRNNDAIRTLEQVVKIRRRTLGSEDNDRLTSELVLAQAYRVAGRVGDVIRIFEHVVEVWKRTLGEEDHHRLASEHELALAYLGDGRIKDATRIFEHVVEVRKRTLDESDSDRLVSEYCLADVYLHDGQIEEAINILEHVVAVEKRILAEDDESGLDSKRLLATAYSRRGRIESVSSPSSIRVSHDKGDHNPLSPEEVLTKENSRIMGSKSASTHLSIRAWFKRSQHRLTNAMQSASRNRWDQMGASGGG